MNWNVKPKAIILGLTVSLDRLFLWDLTGYGIMEAYKDKDSSKVEGSSWSPGYIWTHSVAEETLDHLTCLLQSPEGCDHRWVSACLVWGLNPWPHISKGTILHVPSSSRGISTLDPHLQCGDMATGNHFFREQASSDPKSAGSPSWSFQLLKPAEY